MSQTLAILAIFVASTALIVSLLVAAGVLTWVERRLLGFMQERLGPNRVGPFGFFQWIADTVKLLTKADNVPEGGEPVTFRLAPALAAIPVLAGFGVVAIAPGWSIAALDMGVIFVLGMLALTVYALVLGAWASRNRYALLGGLRAAAQMLSYEAFFGLSLMGVVMLSGSLSFEAHRLGPGRPVVRLPATARLRAVLSRRDRRGPPPAVRPPGIRERPRGRVHDRVFRHELRALLPRRISRDPAGGRAGDDAVLRRLARADPSRARSGSASRSR